MNYILEAEAEAAEAALKSTASKTLLPKYVAYIAHSNLSCDPLSIKWPAG